MGSLCSTFDQRSNNFLNSCFRSNQNFANNTVIMVNRNFPLALAVIVTVLSINCLNCNARNTRNNELDRGNGRIKNAITWMKKQVRKLKKNMNNVLDEVVDIEINAANISAIADEVANNTQQIQNNTDDIANILAIEVEFTTEEPTTPGPPDCPTASNFMSINGTCYAVEKGNRDYDTTQTRCGEIFGEVFGNGVGGKIFEPASVNAVHEIVREAGAIFNALGHGDPMVWLGMTDRDSEGTWAYASSGEPTPGGPNCHYNADDIDCTVMKVSYIPHYTFGCHQRCSQTFGSAICEWVL